jgi:hypothetical protein
MGAGAVGSSGLSDKLPRPSIIFFDFLRFLVLATSDSSPSDSSSSASPLCARSIASFHDVYADRGMICLGAKGAYVSAIVSRDCAIN